MTQEIGKLKLNQIGSFKINSFEELEDLVNNPKSALRAKMK